ncbi:MAG: acyltransferase [Vicingaceae bacterium]|nr:acyltransferase [Vicingaceae bacterium]
MFIHQLADVQTTSIGDKTSIWQFVIVLPDAIIGDNCNICSHCFIENDVTIGNNVTIKSGVQIWDNTLIGDNVHIGANVTFTNDKIPRSKQYKSKWDKTLISEGASIGANSTLVAGIEIGKHALIGAGSVVTKNIGPYEVWYGNPATKKGYITKDGELIGLDLKSKDTNKTYSFIENKIVAND